MISNSRCSLLATFMTLCFLYVHAAVGVAAVEPGAAPSKAQRVVLEQAKNALQEQQAEQALSLLAKWPGNKHALHSLLCGHAYRQLEKQQEAITAYQESLVLDPAQRIAAVSLIDMYAATNAWQSLRPLLEQWVDVDEDELGLIKVMIYCARELKDLRWAEAIIQRARLRFPHSKELRQLDIAVLMDTERWDEAQSAVQQALQSEPQEVRLWQYLAYIYQSLGKNDLALAASEAACLIDPQNESLRVQYIQAQLAAGHAKEAYQAVHVMVKPETVERRLLQLAAQAAYAVQAYDQARAWLQRLHLVNEAPALSAAGEQAMHSLSLRILAEQEDFAALDKQADAFVAAKLIDQQTLLWLAQQAEQRQLFARAEMFYQLVRQAEDKQSKIANLYLARLWYSQGRKQQAQDLLNQHLKQFPLDDSARRLMALMQ